MTLEQYTELPLQEKIKILRQCKIVHLSIEELFECDSCRLALEYATEE